MRPHEEAKLLSPEDLAEEKFPLTLEEWRRVLAHIAALEADKDTLLRSVERLTVEWIHPTEHAKELENGKAERDRLRDGLMEEARWGAVGRAAALALSPFSKSDAELLHVVLRRALVRARTEGLERAATMVRNVGLANLASVIDAAKENEP